MRKMISFKIENLPDKQRQIIDTWADGQSNIQQSLANIVMHIVDFVGNDDVMDFDVQRKLHTIFVREAAPGPIETHPGSVEAHPGSPEDVVKDNNEESVKQPGEAKNGVIESAFEVFDDE